MKIENLCERCHMFVRKCIICCVYELKCVSYGSFNWNQSHTKGQKCSVAFIASIIPDLCVHFTTLCYLINYFFKRKIRHFIAWICPNIQEVLQILFLSTLEHNVCKCLIFGVKWPLNFLCVKKAKDIEKGVKIFRPKTVWNEIRSLI